MREGRWLRASRSGRYDVFGWPASAPRVEVLVDPQAPLRALAMRTLRGRGGAGAALRADIVEAEAGGTLGSLLAERVSRAGVRRLPDLQARLASDADLKVVMLRVTQPAQLPRVPGIYLLRWEQRQALPAQYIGKAEGSLYERVQHHLTAMRRYGLSPRLGAGGVQVYFVTLADLKKQTGNAESARKVENRILTRIVDIARQPGDGRGIAQILRGTFGLTNRQREFEMLLGGMD